MEFEIKDVLYIEILTPESGIFVPEDLKDMAGGLPSAGGDKGVIIGGRAPIWVYGYLIHYYHPRPFVATYDPRLGGAVVVASHVATVKEGDVIKAKKTDIE